MEKRRDIITQIEHDLNEEIIGVLMDLNYHNAVSEFYSASC